MLERNPTNENIKNIDTHSYIIIKSPNFVSTIKDEENKLILGSKNCNKEESNYNYKFDSNFNMIDLNNTHANNIYSHLNEENKAHQITETIPTEELFLKQKEKVKLYKEKNNKNKKEKSLNINNVNSSKSIELLKSVIKSNENKNSGKESINLNQKKILNGTFKIITLDNYQFFEKAYFQLKRKYSNKEESIPILKNVEWKSINSPLNNCEFRKLALRTKNEINYETNMALINVNFTLEGESEFWIFTRCFVNKEINESVNFDINSFNNEPDIVFNKYSSLIKIIKEKYSSRCFVTFGTFCENSKDPNQVHYKTFLKRQLVNFNDNVNFKYLENDICEFNVYISDSGNENIDAKIAMNSDIKYNYVISNFYLPTNKRSKILFCGEGQSVIVKSLKINNSDKNGEHDEQFETFFTFEQKSCSCCNIF